MGIHSLKRILMNRLLGGIVLIWSFAIISCQKADLKRNNNTCNVAEPTEELAWLKAEIDEYRQDEYTYYVMATYKRKTVFYNGNCNPAVNYASSVRNCSGELIGYRNDLGDEFTNETVIYKHENSKCNFQ